LAFKCAYYGWSYGEALRRSPVLWTTNRRGLLLWHVLWGKVCVHYLMYYFSVLNCCKARSFQSFSVSQTNGASVTCTYIKDRSWNLPIFWFSRTCTSWSIHAWTYLIKGIVWSYVVWLSGSTRYSAFSLIPFIQFQLSVGWRKTSKNVLHVIKKSRVIECWE